MKPMELLRLGWGEQGKRLVTEGKPVTIGELHPIAWMSRHWHDLLVLGHHPDCDRECRDCPVLVERNGARNG